MEEDYIISKKDWVDFFGDNDIISKEEYYRYLECKRSKTLP